MLIQERGKMLKNTKKKVILNETKNLMRSFTSVQDDNETGRSMVEMLGMLAIIGVLSVAGIAGYSMAMRNHRANEIANAASMLYIMGIAQNQGNGDGNLEYATVAGQNPSGVTSITYVGESKTVTITLKNEADCSIVADKLGGTCSGTTLTVVPGGTVTTADPCAGFEATICRTACTNNNGEPQYTYAEEGTSCESGGYSACDGEGTCYKCPKNATAGFKEYVDATDVPGCYCTLDNPAWIPEYKECDD